MPSLATLLATPPTVHVQCGVDMSGPFPFPILLLNTTAVFCMPSGPRTQALLTRRAPRELAVVQAVRRAATRLQWTLCGPRGLARPLDPSTSTPWRRGPLRDVREILRRLEAYRRSCLRWGARSSNGVTDRDKALLRTDGRVAGATSQFWTRGRPCAEHAGRRSVIEGMMVFFSKRFSDGVSEFCERVDGKASQLKKACSVKSRARPSFPSSQFRMGLAGMARGRKFWMRASWCGAGRARSPPGHRPPSAHCSV